MYTVTQCAYNVTLADPIVNVVPVARGVPDPFAAVFQPVNECPVRARFPVLFNTVIVLLVYHIHGYASVSDWLIAKFVGKMLLDCE